jgi:hypothetical protein
MTIREQERHPLSTVALSGYNMIAIAGAMTVERLHAKLAGSQHPGLTMEQTRAALDALVERKRVTLRDGVYDVQDRERRPVVARDRSDAEVLDDGQVVGGWNGWRVRADKERALLILDEVLS